MKLRKPSPAMVVACIALLSSLAPAAYAANTVFSTDIVDGEVKAVDIDVNAVNSSKVASNSLTGADLKGANASAVKLSVAAGAVGKSRCKDISKSVSGASAGEAVVVSLEAAAPKGMVVYGAAVPATNTVKVKVCNLTGGASPAISNLPLRIFTFG